MHATNEQKELTVSVSLIWYQIWRVCPGFVRYINKKSRGIPSKLNIITSLLSVWNFSFKNKPEQSASHNHTSHEWGKF